VRAVATIMHVQHATPRSPPRSFSGVWVVPCHEHAALYLQSTMPQAEVLVWLDVHHYGSRTALFLRPASMLTSCCSRAPTHSNMAPCNHTLTFLLHTCACTCTVAVRLVRAHTLGNALSLMRLLCSIDVADCRMFSAIVCQHSHTHVLL
jgi:hypothetical protein